jgi:hypothetical protein
MPLNETVFHDPAQQGGRPSAKGYGHPRSFTGFSTDHAQFAIGYDHLYHFLHYKKHWVSRDEDSPAYQKTKATDVFVRCDHLFITRDLYRRERMGMNLHLKKAGRTCTSGAMLYGMVLFDPALSSTAPVDLSRLPGV